MLVEIKAVHKFEDGTVFENEYELEVDNNDEAINHVNELENDENVAYATYKVLCDMED